MASTSALSTDPTGSVSRYGDRPDWNRNISSKARRPCHTLGLMRLLPAAHLKTATIVLTLRLTTLRLKTISGLPLTRILAYSFRTASNIFVVNRFAEVEP